MIRTLLATTAIATLVATGAIAQTTPTTTAPMQAPAAATDAPMVVHADGMLASNLIGETVYNGAGDNAENIGEINDIVLSNDGQIEAVIIGVGGFLGIGQKDVAIEYSLIEWAERDNDRYVVVETTEDALRAQEEFDRAAYEPMPADAQVTKTQPATKEQLDTAKTQVEQERAADQQQAQAPADTAAPAPANNAAPANNMAADRNATAPAGSVAPANNNMAANPPASNDAAATDNTQTSAVDRTGMTEVGMNEMRTEDLVGTTVYGANDENIGEVGDVILSNEKVDAIIIDVGGFLGIGEKEVAVGMDNLSFMRDGDGEFHLYTTFTEEQLEAQAEYDESGYAANRDTMRMNSPVRQQ